MGRVSSVSRYNNTEMCCVLSISDITDYLEIPSLTTEFYNHVKAVG